jgi:hypothetical protein
MIDVKKITSIMGCKGWKICCLYFKISYYIISTNDIVMLTSIKMVVDPKWHHSYFLWDNYGLGLLPNLSHLTLQIPIFVSISQLRVRVLLELNVDYPFSSKENFSRSCRLPTSCWLRLWITHLLLVSYFIVFIIMFTSMEEVLIVFKNLE